MTLRSLWAPMAVGAGVALLALAFWDYGAVGAIWLLQALPGCS